MLQFPRRSDAKVFEFFATCKVLVGTLRVMSEGNSRYDPLADGMVNHIDLDAICFC